jgi:outer membrane protein assembly factor BamB
MSRTARRVAGRRQTRLTFAGLVVILAAVTGAIGVWRFGLLGGTGGGDALPSGGRTTEESEPRDNQDTDQTDPSPEPTHSPSSGPQPINRTFPGLTTFRGNATRSYYGEGPVPRSPEVKWRYPPSGGLCKQSTAGGETKVWCGTGWTGQPNVVERRGGKIQVRFGAYDGAIHVVNGRTGRDAKEPFPTGDIIKGTVSTDPDGYPLLYSGSRDNFFRVLALDRGREMVELWRLSADSAPNPVWNNDFDSSALVIRDHLLVGGENSWFYVVKLNRGYDSAGKVIVRPEIRALFPGYDDQLFADLGDQNVSIEGSPAFHQGVVYFANSGGLVQGWDISGVLAGGDDYRRVFRFWTGDDVDASVVVDDEGFLYVASELERFNARAGEVGQLVKLDPRRRKGPVVWSVDVPGAGGNGGIWATPALYGNGVFFTVNTGGVWGVNRKTGKVRWRIDLPGPTWSSPAVVDGVMVVGDCSGVLHAYDLGDRPLGRPSEMWRIQLEGCIESTPAVWRGRVFVGARGGGVYAIGER